MPKFSHLHVHTQFSLLDGAADVSKLFKKAVADNMPALAMTDHGNMFGAFKFVAEAGKHNTPDNPNKIKPIVGCEFYLVEDRHKRQFTKDDKDVRCHQVLLAKNSEGYKNLVKLCSLGFIEGLYGKYPRIDKELILKYHTGLIATTCCLAAEVPRTILKKGEAEAEKVFKWWLDLFGEDYYVEMQRHDIPEQNTVNEVLLKFARKYNVKIIASNDSHYVDQKDSNAHDILLCINTGEKQSTPSAKDFSDDSSMKGKRFAFYNDQFYFKTTDEMSRVFSDLPEALDNTNEIVDKVQPLKLKQDIMLPHYKIPEGFQTQDEYLKHITYEGALERYKELTPEIEERLNFELFTVKTMGFAGYFLIVADFIKAGRNMGVFVGPGRGSAAGSVIAYCLGITNIDPIKYNLLFERFLNPDRKSMPDIDTDFDDEGRQKVIDYVVEKYGKNQVAQIVTYGTMAAKMSIKDVARVLDLPLQDSNMLAKLVPDRPGIALDRVINAPIEGGDGLKVKENLGADELEDVKKLRHIHAGTDMQAKVLKEALILEGSVRGTGIHAAGIIIAPKDLTEIIPVFTSKETELLITQFEGKIIEDAGVIKMDFLGLKTLTIIRDALILIKQNHGVDINIDNIPFDDKKTFELFQKGATIGIFQFEASHVIPILKDMKPTTIEDLIALNALNRPGPSAYIPNYIKRKHGQEKIVYDLPEMEEYLKETYGITVYQEQVMLLSQKIGGFTKGDADVLRKAMGKKDRATLDKMKAKFIEGGKTNNHPADKLEKIWTDWEAFAQYAFNKSHSTCYAFVAFQTAYLKANYPAEFMASVLTHNLSNLDKVTFFMEECSRMGRKVLGPDINESHYKFSVNKNGEIRFGLGAVKGVGEAAVISIVDERNANGNFGNVFDLVRRVNLRTANKKTFESLVQAGGFDSFGVHRATYFHSEGNDGVTFLEKLIRYGASTQEKGDANQHSLFDMAEEVKVPEPKIPQCEPWAMGEKLKFEKDVVGFYISGHPLDNFKIEIDNFCSHKIVDIKNNMGKFKNRDFSFGGMVSQASHRISKNGKPFGSFVIEDFTESIEIVLFGDDYVKFKPYLTQDYFLFVKAKVGERFHQPDNLELKVSSIVLLGEIRDKMTKSITLSMPLSALNEPFIEKMKNMLASSPGKCFVKFSIIDDEEKMNVEMQSKKTKIALSDELIKQLGECKEVKYKLN